MPYADRSRRWRVFVFLAALCMAFLVNIVTADGLPPAGGDIAPWRGAKSVDIAGADWPADQTDYQIMIVCHKEPGKDAGPDVHLGANVRDDFGDIRFRDASGELAYWMEKCVPGKQAIFWVKVPRIPAGGAVSIQLLHGNPEAATTSDGRKTFKFFEDFLEECSKAQGTLPQGWELAASHGRVKDWIAKDGVIGYHDNGHLNTVERVWPDPREEPQTLRFRAMWPDPPFINRKENGASIGGVSWNTTHSSAYMDCISLYQTKKKTSASFGCYDRNARRGSQDAAAFHGNSELKLFKKAYTGEFLTFEIERKTNGTVSRVVEAGDEVKSERIVPDSLHVMIHSCHLDYADSPYVYVDWILLRKQAYPDPSYGEWTSLK